MEFERKQGSFLLFEIRMPSQLSYNNDFQQLQSYKNIL